MNYVHIVAMLAVLQFLIFAILVGRARGTHGVPAPATSGHEIFDRAFRVQMNTLEQLVAFLPGAAGRWSVLVQPRSSPTSAPSTWSAA